MSSADALSLVATVSTAIFVAELADKDALFLLTLATKKRPLWVFAAGSIAFTATAAIIVLISSAIVNVIPVGWVKVAGGLIMVGYGLWEFAKGTAEAESIEKREAKLLKRDAHRWAAFAAAIGALMVLDLAGDATELLIVVFVAQYQEVLLVFLASVAGLIVATAFETVLGSRLSRLLTPKRIRYFSIVVPFAIGAVVIASSVASL